MQFTYSIIIPHRDSLDLIKRAITSVPDRTDIQIIVVDNSTSKLDFNNLYTKINSNILLLSSDLEKGAGHARNVGLKKAQGIWLLFLDADDFYNPGAFEKFDTYNNSDFDIVYYSLNSVYSDTLILTDRLNYNNKLVNDINYSYFPASKMI